MKSDTNYSIRERMANSIMEAIEMPYSHRELLYNLNGTGIALKRDRTPEHIRDLSRKCFLDRIVVSPTEIEYRLSEFGREALGYAFTILCGSVNPRPDIPTFF